MPDYSKAVWAPSPNFWSGRSGEAIKAIVLHGTAGGGAVQWFANPASQVSAHYVVDTDGAVTQCVAEADSAWHAGVVTPNSQYSGGPNPNLWSLGIEHVRDAANSSPLTDTQLAASLDLVRDIVRRRGKLKLLAHDQIDVGRVCPGPGFPLPAFQEAINPPSPPADPLDAEASSYYFQRGVRVDKSHAIWGACLLPLYAFWMQLAANGNALSDLVKPGPVVQGETDAAWGGSRPAHTVRLTNRVVGVFLGPDGEWRPYQAELL